MAMTAPIAMIVHAYTDFNTLSTSPISFKYFKYLPVNCDMHAHSMAGMMASIKLPPSDPVMATTE